jgi:hypothetical protein
MIDSTVTAAAGVSRVDLTVGGQVVRHDVPPSGNPTTFRVSQPWTPETEGQALVSVVGYDVNGASGQATLTLQVVSSGGVVPTDGPGTVVPPEPTETPPPPVTTEAGCTLDSQYVADVTIPDGTVMSPGAGFVKTWKVKNSGTCDWDAGFQLIFVGGDQMGGPASVALPAVPAGGQTDVSVNLMAPTTYGTHKGTWRIRSDEGTVFGTNLTVVIEVPAPVTDTPLPTGVPTDPPTGVPTDVPTLGPPAITLSPPPFTQYATSKVTLAGNSTGHATATCPVTAIVVGGGYAAGSEVMFYRQYKYGNGWRGYAKNNASSSQQITVFAVCLNNVYSVSVDQYPDQVTISPGQKGQAIAYCPAGSIATGGGWVHNYPDGGLRVYNSSKTDSGEGWQAWAHNVGSSDKTLQVYAVCLSGSGGTTSQIVKSTSIAAGTTGFAAPTCGSGSLVTGGGFSIPPLAFHVYSSSGPYSGDEWRVYARNNHASDTKKLHAYAICLSLP